MSMIVNLYDPQTHKFLGTMEIPNTLSEIGGAIAGETLTAKLQLNGDDVSQLLR